MRKALGEEKTAVRKAAIAAVKRLSGRNIKTFKETETRDLLIALCQLLGLADKDGNIK